MPHKSISGNLPVLGEHSIDVSHNFGHQEIGSKRATGCNEKEDQTDNCLILQLEDLWAISQTPNFYNPVSNRMRSSRNPANL